MFDCNDLDDFIDESIDDFVVGDDDRFFGCDLDESWNLHTLLNHFLNFVDLWHFVDHLHDLFLHD